MNSEEKNIIEQFLYCIPETNHNYYLMGYAEKLKALEALLASQPSAPTEAASGVGLEKLAEDYGEEHGEWITKVHQYFTGDGIQEGFIAGYNYAVSALASTPPTATPEAAKEQGEEDANEWAEQMMGLGAYKEEWHRNDKTMYNTLVKAVKYGLTKSTTTLPASTALNDGWISVEERLPDMIGGEDFSRNVLAIIKGSDKLFVMCYTMVDAQDESGKDVSGCVWANCYGRLDEDADAEWDDDYNVTHWQPLPTPPKK